MKHTTATPTTPVATRVERLRSVAEADLQAAQDQAIAWLARLTRDFDAPGIVAEINELFALGTPPQPAGPSRAHLIGWGDWDGIDPTGRAVFTFIKTTCNRFGTETFWLGKKYNPRGNSTNQFTLLFGNVARFIFPGVLKRVDGLYEGLDMVTYVEEAYSSPGTAALILDFAPITSNPKLGRNIRDEVVQIVPGVHLARKTWHNGKGDYPLIAHWYETVDVPTQA